MKYHLNFSVSIQVPARSVSMPTFQQALFPFTDLAPWTNSSSWRFLDTDTHFSASFLLLIFLILHILAMTFVSNFIRTNFYQLILHLHRTCPLFSLPFSSVLILVSAPTIPLVAQAPNPRVTLYSFVFLTPYIHFTRKSSSWLYHQNVSRIATLCSISTATFWIKAAT